MLDIHYSRTGSSYPCPCSSSPSDGRFCCTHIRRKELHMTLQVRSFEVQNNHRYSCSYTSYPCPCSSSPSGGRFCHKHNYIRTQGLRTREQWELRSCPLARRSGEQSMMEGYSSQECHKNNPCPCPSPSSPSGGKFSCTHSCPCHSPSPH